MKSCSKADQAGCKLAILQSQLLEITTHHYKRSIKLPFDGLLRPSGTFREIIWYKLRPNRGVCVGSLSLAVPWYNTVLGKSRKPGASIFERARDCRKKETWRGLGDPEDPQRLYVGSPLWPPHQTGSCGEQRLWGRRTVLGIQPHLWERSCCRGAVSLVGKDPAWAHVALAGGWAATKDSWDEKPSRYPPAAFANREAAGMNHLQSTRSNK